MAVIHTLLYCVKILGKSDKNFAASKSISRAPTQNSNLIINVPYLCCNIYKYMKLLNCCRQYSFIFSFAVGMCAGDIILTSIQCPIFTLNTVQLSFLQICIYSIVLIGKHKFAIGHIGVMLLHFMSIRVLCVT